MANESRPASQPEVADLPTPEQTAALICSRRTIHQFEPESPPRAVIRRALDLARWAPNHRLTEPWRFYLLGPETADAVARLNAEIVAEARGAAAGENKLKRWRSMPGWLVVTARRSDDLIRDREDYAATCCAVQNLQLYLWSQGIGVKWTTGAVTRDARFFDLVGIDAAAERLVGMLWYGYPADIPETPRTSLSDVLVERP